MDRNSSVAERVLNRRKRKREDSNPDQRQGLRGSVSQSSKEKARGFKGGSFMNNAEVVVINLSDSESDSEGSSAASADEEEEGVIYVDLVHDSDLSSASSESDRDDFEAKPRSIEKEPSLDSERKKKKASESDSEGSSSPPAVSADEEEEEVIYVDLVQPGVSDLSSASGESDRDDFEVKPRSIEKEPKKASESDSEEEDVIYVDLVQPGVSDLSSDSGESDRDEDDDFEVEPRSTKKEPSFEKKKKKKKASMEEEHEVGGSERSSRVNYLRKGKKVVSDDDDTDPHDHEKKPRAQKDGLKDSDEEEVSDSEIDRCLASFHSGHSCSLDSSPGNENDEPHANEEEESGESDSENELDNLWAEMNLSLAFSQIGNTSSLHSQRRNSYGKTLCNHDFFLDEEIGRRCRLCSFVEVEIKDYIEPMSKFAAERWGNRRLYGEENLDGYGGMKSEASTGDPEETSAQGTVWDLIPGVRKEMYAHQREGLEFIWRNLAETIRLDELKGTCTPKEKVGCIVSHGPGTGKSKLALTFLQSFLARFESCKPVIIAPAGMLLTWEGEFRKWNIGIPFHNLNSSDFSGNESPLAMKPRRHQGQTPDHIRMVKLLSWKMQKSILGISYNLYEKLAGESFAFPKGKKKEVRKMLLELPTLLILDEGHTPRNKRSQIWQALSKSQAQRRIILSGTPFQNNFEELYNVIRLVRPRLARKFSSILVNSSNKKQTRNKNDDEIKKLKDLINPFVHHKGGILERSLPGLRSCVVGFNPSDFLKELLVKIQSTQSNFKLEHKESLAAVHPSLLLDCGLSEEEESNIDGDMLQSLTGDPKEGAKTRFLEEFIRLCNAKDEKVLVFSQFIHPINFIGEQLCSLFGWSEGREVLLMHGKLQQKQRQALINSFNDPSHKSRVLIASIKACSEGINLIGASRVVLLDVVWNPSVVRQAISRAYRIGQKRIVYSYHLITRGTREWEKYRKQAEKERISEMMFTCGSKEKCDGYKSDAVWEDDVLEELVTHEKLKGKFDKVIYHHPTESNLVESFGQ